MSDRVEQFRQLVFAGIDQALEIDDYCKPYEGRIIVRYPVYFGSDEYQVEMFCHVFGPSNYYVWTGATLSDAIDKAEADVRRWIVAELGDEALGKAEADAKWWIDNMEGD